MNFTEEQIERYSRHIILPEIGGHGQAKLLNAKVFMIGAGGLGSPIGLYLAAAGVGTLGIADADHVDLSNLQRQIAHRTDTVGVDKVESIKRSINAINPDVNVVTYPERITADNILSIIRDYDVIVDGCDNFPTRFLVNDACFFEKKPLVSGAIFRWDGQVTTFRPHQDENGPCYRCLYPEPPPPGLVPSCSEAGILGAIAGIIGTIQAAEVVKEILGVGRSLSGSLMIYDALDAHWRKVKVRKDPNCPLCGPNPTVRELITYEQACTIG